MSKQKHGKRYSEEQIIRILDEVRVGKLATHTPSPGAQQRARWYCRPLASRGSPVKAGLDSTSVSPNTTIAHPL